MSKLLLVEPTGDVSLYDPKTIKDVKTHVDEQRTAIDKTVNDTVNTLRRENTHVLEAIGRGYSIKNCTAPNRRWNAHQMTRLEGKSFHDCMHHAIRQGEGFYHDKNGTCITKNWYSVTKDTMPIWVPNAWRNWNC